MDLEDIPASVLQGDFGIVDIKQEEGDADEIVAERTEVTVTSDGELTTSSATGPQTKVFGLALKHNQTSKPLGDAVVLRASPKQHQGRYLHGYRFVNQAKPSNRYYARVSIGGFKSHVPGTFKHAVDAAHTADRRAVELGLSARDLNFPENYERHCDIIQARASAEDHEIDGLQLSASESPQPEEFLVSGRKFDASAPIPVIGRTGYRGVYSSPNGTFWGQVWLTKITYMCTGIWTCKIACAKAHDAVCAKAGMQNFQRKLNFPDEWPEQSGQLSQEEISTLASSKLAQLHSQCVKWPTFKKVTKSSERRKKNRDSMTTERSEDPKKPAKKRSLPSAMPVTSPSDSASLSSSGVGNYSSHNKRSRKPNARLCDYACF